MQRRHCIEDLQHIWHWGEKDTRVVNAWTARLHAETMADILAVPVHKCVLRPDDRSRMFKAGYRFPEPMTYHKLCEFISKESNKAGFDPLRPRVHNVHRLLDYVTFYCVHSRDHGDQSRVALGKAESSSKRANRSEEGTRCMYTSCEFSIKVQRSRAVDLPLPAAISKEDFREIKKNSKYDWYMDSEEDQKKEERRILKDCHCLTHTGHPKRVHPIADVNDAMRERIALLAQNNVSVASIQSSILQEFKVMLSDFQVILLKLLTIAA